MLTLIYLLFTCNRPPKYQEEIEKIRKAHTGKADFEKIETKVGTKNGLQHSD
jgi:hypothetical protein